MCASVTVCELADRILPTILDDHAAGRVRRHVEAHGIAVLTGDTVARAESEDNILRRVVLRSGAVLECDLLVVAVGVRPNVALARAAGCTIGRGIRTGRDMSTDVPDIWAAGDCTESNDLLDGTSKILALWPNAVAQADCRQRDGGRKQDFDGAFAMNAIDFFGLRMVTSGLLQVEDPAYRIEIREDEGSYRRFVVRDNLLRGYCLVGTSIVQGFNHPDSDDVPLDTLAGDYGAGIGLLAFPAEERRRMLYGDIR
jgi:NADPH-dependent 2,4-dienoyl-CoA reductase/sulfur reductase-like enzyme